MNDVTTMGEYVIMWLIVGLSPKPFLIVNNIHVQYIVRIAMGTESVVCMYMQIDLYSTLIHKHYLSSKKHIISV